MSHVKPMLPQDNIVNATIVDDLVVVDNMSY
jgi:hypothetical protein